MVLIFWGLIEERKNNRKSGRSEAVKTSDSHPLMGRG
jgi:hypothetical protein